MSRRQVVDILQMEIDAKAQHWLSPYEKLSTLRKEIVAKHRAAWLAKRKAERQRANEDVDYIQGPDGKFQGSHPKSGGDEGGTGKTGKTVISSGGGASKESHGGKGKDKEGSGKSGGGATGSDADKAARPHAGSVGGGPHGGTSAAYASGSGSGPGRVGILKDVAVKATFSPTDTGKADLEAHGATPIAFNELGDGGASAFRTAIEAAKAASPHGAAVTLYDLDDYKGMRTFLSDDGKVGFALKGDDIVSVFRHPDSNVKRATASILALAIEQGGRRLDCFDTELPRLYGLTGFRAVARLAFDPQYQPPGWDDKVFAKFNGGRPDVVFMVYDPKYGNRYLSGDGKVVADYDAGIAAQHAALAGIEKPTHPGHGYSAAAIDRGGVIYTTSVLDAARALYENRHVVLDQPRQVSTLLDHLGQVAKHMIAMGKKAPTFNLCNVTVAGTNLFCAESKGIPRVQMPQLPGDQGPAFRSYLEAKGYRVEKTTESADHLRATQSELNGAKVAAVAEKMRDDAELRARELFVSRDNYVVDGHHTWAAKVGLDAEDNKLGAEAINIERVDADIITLLREADLFTKGAGHKSVAD